MHQSKSSEPAVKRLSFLPNGLSVEATPIEPSKQGIESQKENMILEPDKRARDGRGSWLSERIGGVSPRARGEGEQKGVATIKGRLQDQFDRVTISRIDSSA